MVRCLLVDDDAEIRREVQAYLQGFGFDTTAVAAGAGLQLNSLARGRVLAVSVLTIRHLALPLIAFGLSRVFGLSAVQTTMLLVFSALPTSSSSYVLAARMGYNGPYVAGLVTLSTLLGMASLPLALGLIGRMG